MILRTRTCHVYVCNLTSVCFLSQCGACGQIGHMRTNKVCRLFEQTMQELNYQKRGRKPLNRHSVHVTSNRAMANISSSQHAETLTFRIAINDSQFCIVQVAITEEEEKLFSKAAGLDDKELIKVEGTRVRLSKELLSQ